MSFEATVTSKGQLTIPKAVRERLDIEPGQTVLFRFDDEGGVRLVNVPADPMERLDAARKRTESLDLDARELIERERKRWDRAR